MEKYSNIEKRQFALLYDLVFSNTYLTYDYLKNLFNITEKTIREDIKTINFYYKVNKIQILYKKEYGFYISGSNAAIEKLKSQLESIYTDSFDVEYNSSTYTRKIIDALYEQNGKIKSTEIARLLNLSIRTTSKIVPEIREVLSTYSCELISKPHYGFVLYGKELNCRMLFANNLQKFIFDTNEETIFDKSYAKVMAICKEYCLDDSIPFSQSALEKIISYILVADKRIQNQFDLKSISVEQKEMIDSAYKKLNFDQFVSKLCLAQKIVLSESEKYTLCVLFLIFFDLCGYIENAAFTEMADCKYNQILDRLTEIGFYNSNDEQRFRKFVRPLIEDYVLIDSLKLPDHIYSSFSRKTINSSSFSCAIAQQIYAVLIDESEYANNCFYLKLCFAIYSYIRSISVTKRLNKVAVYTPYNTLYGESLNRRIMNRWKDIIKSIQVVSLSDLEDEETLKNFDCLIYADCVNPLKDKKSIKTLKVDYYFSNTDVSNFYEKIFIPSHIYRRAFGKVHKEDYYLDYEYTDFEEIRILLYASAKSQYVRKQIDNLKLSEKLMHDGTLNITLYCQNIRNAFSKLFFLKKHATEKGYRFNRIFVHCIALNHDLYCLRTTEKIMRNILVFDDTTTEISVEPFRDFYNHYLGMDDLLQE